MSLPATGYIEVLKALQKKLLFYTSISPIIIENGDVLWTSIPRRKELGKGLILKIISDCGLTKKEFIQLL
ncbi:MAG: hypothetical protein ACE5GR_09050 [Nitrosopumilus sp.]